MSERTESESFAGRVLARFEAGETLSTADLLAMGALNPAATVLVLRNGQFDGNEYNIIDVGNAGDGKGASKKLDLQTPILVPGTYKAKARLCDRCGEQVEREKVAKTQKPAKAVQAFLDWVVENPHGVVDVQWVAQFIRDGKKP